MKNRQVALQTGLLLVLILLLCACGAGTEGVSGTSFAMGSLISSVRTADGRILVTGYNKYGQLGDGTRRSSETWV